MVGREGGIGFCLGDASAGGGVGEEVEFFGDVGVVFFFVFVVASFSFLFGCVA